MNPKDMMTMLKGIRNPKQAVLNMIGNNTNPMIKNLVKMANSGNTQGIEWECSQEGRQATANR